MKTFLRVAMIVALVSAGACAKKNARDESSGSSSSESGGPSGGSGSESMVGTPSSTGAGSLAAAKQAGTVIYFEFDSSEINPAGQAIVGAWASYLAANPTAKVRLEGNTDERGTREYNVALGERRGNSVMQALAAQGVSDRQVGVSSFGEEKPVSMGHDEAAWAQNRRVEIVQ